MTEGKGLLLCVISLNYYYYLTFKIIPMKYFDKFLRFREIIS